MKLYAVVEYTYFGGMLGETLMFGRVYPSVDKARSEIEVACRELWESLGYEGEDLEANPYEPASWSEDRLTAYDRGELDLGDDWTEWRISEVEFDE